MGIYGTYGGIYGPNPLGPLAETSTLSLDPNLLSRLFDGIVIKSCGPRRLKYLSRRGATTT